MGANSKLAWFLAFAWALLIASLSVGYLPPMQGLDWLSPDKLGHLSFYAVLAGLIWRAWTLSNWPWALPAAWLLAFGYGASLEVVQAYLPHRSFDYADALANALGASLGLYLSKRFLKI